MNRIIWVYDDTTRRGIEYANRLKGLEVITRTFNRIEPMPHEDFKQGLENLVDRQRKSRFGEKWGDSLAFDETSILIIDYDLLKNYKETFLTGENVAYLVRCFSTCGLIIGLNQFIKQGENRFDLTMRGHLESFCDLNIEDKQLANLGLWSTEKELFRPWYWPNLPNYLACFERKVKRVIDILEQPICDVLGIEKIVKSLPKSVLTFLGRKLEKTSIRDFVIKSGNGLKARDKKPNDEIVSRVAVARLSKWLERIVLPGQDSLIDAPHLVSRYPSLLQKDPSDVNVWNKTTKLDTYDELGLKHELIEDFRFQNVDWISRPVWLWRDVSNCLQIEEVKEPWVKKSYKYVFCEDTSSFYAREYCREFKIDSESPYLMRFIRYLRKVDYKPKVDYEPRARLL